MTNLRLLIKILPTFVILTTPFAILITVLLSENLSYSQAVWYCIALGVSIIVSNIFANRS